MEATNQTEESKPSSRTSSLDWLIIAIPGAIRTQCCVIFAALRPGIAGLALEFFEVFLYNSVILCSG